MAQQQGCCQPWHGCCCLSHQHCTQTLTFPVAARPLPSSQAAQQQPHTCTQQAAEVGKREGNTWKPGHKAKGAHKGQSCSFSYSLAHCQCSFSQHAASHLLRSPAPGLVQMPRCSRWAAVADTARKAAVISSEPSAALAAALQVMGSAHTHTHWDEICNRTRPTLAGRYHSTQEAGR